MDVQSAQDETVKALRAAGQKDPVDVGWLDRAFLTAAQGGRTVKRASSTAVGIYAATGTFWGVAFTGGPGTVAYMKGYVLADGKCVKYASPYKVIWLKSEIVGKCTDGTAKWRLYWN